MARDAMRAAAPKAGDVDEARLEERARLGAMAEQYLDNEAMRLFQAESEAKLVDELTRLPIGDEAGRRNIAIAIQVGRQYWRWLAETTKDGRVASKRLDELRKVGKGKAFF